MYTVLFCAALLLASPYYLVRFRRYVPTLKDRFGFLKIPRIPRSIWVHAVSVGEVQAVHKLIQRLRTSYPQHSIVVTTVTPTGQKLAREKAGLADHVFYFPFDLPGAIRRTLNHVRPELVIIAETEIWPNFLRECRTRGIKVMMVNGRISDHSLPRYRLVRRWLKHVLNDYAVLGMQSEIDRQRIEMIGASSHKVAVFGNLKYDALATNRPLEPTLEAALAQKQPLWIAASTMPGEEEHILDAFAEVRRQCSNVTLLIAPRHPERFDEVERLAQSRGYRCNRRTSLIPALIPGGQTIDVLLLDTIGELASTFRYAAVVFMGGSLVPRGGHNVLEPAAFSKPIVFGPHMENFRDMSELFLEARAAIQVQTARELAATVGALLGDSKSAAALGDNARRVVDRNTGATERIMTFLQPAGAAR